MADNDERQEVIQRGHAAKVLLDNPATDYALDLLQEKNYRSYLAASGDAERLEKWALGNAIQAVRGQLEALVQRGIAAQNELKLDSAGDKE